MVSGGAAGIDGFLEALEARFELPVTRFDPFRQVTVDAKKLGETERVELAPTVVVAVGLALRRVDDR